MIPSRKSNAVAALRNHLTVINYQQKDPDYIWLDQLADMVSRYVGPESRQFQGLTAKINMFEYSLRYGPVWVYNSSKRDYEYDPNICKKLIDDYITFINHNGVYEDKSNSNNILGTVDNSTLAAIVIALLSAVGVACYQVGLNNGKSEQALISSKPKTDTVFIERPIKTILPAEHQSIKNKDGEIFRRP